MYHTAQANYTSLTFRNSKKTNESGLELTFKFQPTLETPSHWVFTNSNALKAADGAFLPLSGRLKCPKNAC
jgi:hypothetical protein